ncbi:MFS transporter [Bacillus sp. ISL-53]|nr:MFS transporter [Bacillus sp. ISL-53]
MGGVKLIKIFKNQNYTLLFLANITSQMGATIGLTAIMFFMLDKYSSQPSYTSITELMYSLPTLAVFFIVGVIADKIDRKKVATNCDFISAGISLLLLFAFIKESIILIFMLLFLRSAISRFFQPAQQAIIQGILKEDEYTIAAGLNQMVGSLFMLVGNGIGIIVYKTLGVEGAIIIDFFSFLVSGLLIYSCKLSEIIRLPNGKSAWQDFKLRSIMNDFKNGLAYIFRNKLLLSLTFGFFIFGFVNGGLAVLPAFIMKYKIAPETYETAMIWFGIVFGSGMLIGSLLASAIASKLKLHQLIITGLFVTGLTLGISGFTNNIYIFLSLIFVFSLFLPVANIGIGGWLPRIIKPEMMGRVQGCITPLMMLAQSIALGGITFTYPKFLGLEMTYILIGSILLGLSLMYLIILPKYTDLEDSNEKLSMT